MVSDVSGVNPSCLEAGLGYTPSSHNSPVRDGVAEGQTPLVRSELPEWADGNGDYVCANPLIHFLSQSWSSYGLKRHSPRRLNETLSVTITATSSLLTNRHWVHLAEPKPATYPRREPAGPRRRAVPPPAPLPRFAYQELLTLINI